MLLQKVVVVPVANGVQVISSLLWHPSRVWWCSWALVLVRIKFRAMQQMFLIHGRVWHLAYCALTRFM